ncbi:hypothetical protein PAXRUDRAFT_165735 [Paxillus rubicundulus Ve08.2h10]|uniref:Uncharacterized protein n=1 Tax=Paxillus rubicundulus Ve08.2h10 TaxID=930991 RepID=A0A0D0C3P6_9AGAM|nr:hypothetical protein PAXRUDRAFT_165735 [Paxillus rubicundulus Ve08.2h10]
MANPHEQEVPDYTSIKYTEACAMFMADGKSDAEATLILTNVWHFNNTHACQLWNRQQEALEEARLTESAHLAELKEQEKATKEEEEELARRKEGKKYKNKYVPIPKTPLSDTLTFTPCHYADAKTHSGDYCPLFYYTNKGHGNNLSLPDLDDGTLALIWSESRDVVLQAAAEAKAKHCTPDKDLSWEEFSEANIRMLRDMERHSWEKARIDMVRSFWIEIESYHWRHNINNSNKCALLVFQGRVRQQWHACIGTPAVFSLVPISDQRIIEYCDKIVDNAKSLEIAKLQQVRLILCIVLFFLVTFLMFPSLSPFCLFTFPCHCCGLSSLPPLLGTTNPSPGGTDFGFIRTPVILVRPLPGPPSVSG